MKRIADFSFDRFGAMSVFPVYCVFMTMQIIFQNGDKFVFKNKIFWVSWSSIH